MSDTRGALRRHFLVDAESIVCRTLLSLAERGEIGREVVARGAGPLPAVGRDRSGRREHRGQRLTWDPIALAATRAQCGPRRSGRIGDPPGRHR